ncbi:MAG: nuclear transport factor 2 family protein [Acidimicrobiia bacterium]
MTARFGDDGFLKWWGHAWSCGDPEELVPGYAPDGRYTDVSSNVTCVGHDQLRRFYRWMLSFAPDSEVIFGSAHGDAGGFAATWTWSGTASGPLQVDDRTYQASGVRFVVPGVAFCTLAADGTMASHEDYWDRQGILTQLRLVEPA